LTVGRLKAAWQATFGARLLEETLEHSENSANAVEHLARNNTSWEVRRPGDLSAYSYVKGWVEIHFHVRVRWAAAEGVSDDWSFSEHCVTFRGIPGTDEQLEFMVDSAEGGYDWFEYEFADGSQSETDILVLVLGVKHLQCPERLVEWVRSAVRLQPFDQCPWLLRNRFDVPRVELRGVGEDRELRRGVVGFGPGEVPGEMVEGGTSVVNAVANEQRPVRRKRLFKRDRVAVVSALPVELVDGGIRTGNEVGNGFGIERLKVILCSF
jgi:hypothetical protein